MKRTALLVGVGEYRDKLTSTFEFAREDATRLAECLADACAFDHVRLLADPEGHFTPDLAHVTDTLEELAAAVCREDLFLFGFFGHCVEREGRPYLLMQDSRQAQPDKCGLSLASLHRILTKVEAKRRVLLLDAFRGSPRSWKADADNLLSRAIAEHLTSLAEAHPPTVQSTTVILSACAPGARGYACTETRHGVFARFLIESLNRAPEDKSGLEIQRLADAVATDVRKWSLENPQSGRPQAVWFEQLGGPVPVVLLGDQEPVVEEDGDENQEAAAPRRPEPHETDEPAPETRSKIPDPDLPPVPSEILTLEQELQELNRQLATLNSGTHPAVIVQRKACTDAGGRVEELERHLEKLVIDIDPETRDHLKQEAGASPDGSLADLCAVAPDVNTDVLLPYLRRLRETECARRTAKAAGREYEEAVTRETAAVQRQIEETTARLEKQQQIDLQRICDGLFQETGHGADFPLDEWICIEPCLKDRYPRWDARTILARAESYHARGLFARAARYEQGNGLPQDKARAIELLQRAAELGDVNAQTDLANRYFAGKDFPRNREAAANWYRKAAEQGHPPAQYSLGWCYRTGAGVKNDHAKAIAWYRRAAENGYAPAQFSLGWCYFSGPTTGGNLPEAVKWYRKAAEQGHADAQFTLGWCYSAGEGVEENLETALRWYRKAAEQGHAEAQFVLGSSFQAGKGVPADPGAAVAWFRKAAEQGHPDGQFHLAECLCEGRGIEPNREEAFTWYKRAADQNQLEAQFALGCRYYVETGSAKNREEAFRWFLKAATRGHVRAQYNVGACYLSGKGAEKNQAKAVEWLTKAGEQGHAKAQYSLGRCYAKGSGLPRDPAQAVTWYRRAAENGDTNAQFRLATHYSLGDGVTRDYKRAVRWFYEAAEKGDARAQYNLGSCYFRGTGVERDVGVALRWFHKAAAAGHLPAKKALGRLGHTSR